MQNEYSGDSCIPYNEPFAFAYEYSDGLRFDTGGCAINGNPPIRTISLYSKQQIEKAIRGARLAEAKKWNEFHYAGELEGDLYWNQHRVAALEQGDAIA